MKYAIPILLLMAAMALRVVASLDYWDWFDQEFPGLWDTSRVVLSQDANNYLADAFVAAERQAPTWAESGFYRPPLASAYFQLLFQAVNFDRAAASMVQSVVAVAGYAFLFLLASRIFSFTVASCALALLALHPVLIFFDTSFEDSVLCFFLLSAALLVLHAGLVRGRAHHYVFAGMLFALCVLTRPNTLLILLLATAVPLWRIVRNGTKPNAACQPPLSVIRVAILAGLPVAVSVVLNMLLNPQAGSGLFPRQSVFGSSPQVGAPEFALLALPLVGIAFYFLRSCLRCRDVSASLYGGLSAALALLVYWPAYPLVIALAGYLFLGMRKNGPVEAVESAVLRGFPGGARAVVALWAPVLVALTLCALHNHRHVGEFTLVTTAAGQNLFWGNSPDPDYRVVLQGYELEPWLSYTNPTSLLFDHLQKDHPAASLDKSMRLAASAYFREQPIAVIAQNFADKLLLSVASYEVPRNRNFAVLKVASPVLGLPYLTFPLVLGLSVFTCLLLMLRQGLACRPQRNAGEFRHSEGGQSLLCILLILPACSLVATETLFFNASRYRSLGLPFLFPLAVASVFMIGRALIRARTLQLVSFLGLTAGFLWLGGQGADRAYQDKQLSVSLYKSARTQFVRDARWHPAGILVLQDEARFLRELNQAMALYPANVSAFNLLAMHQLYVSQDAGGALKRIASFQVSCGDTRLCGIVSRRLRQIGRNPSRHVARIGAAMAR